MFPQRPITSTETGDGRVTGTGWGQGQRKAKAKRKRPLSENSDPFVHCITTEIEVEIPKRIVSNRTEFIREISSNSGKCMESLNTQYSIRFGISDQLCQLSRGKILPQPYLTPALLRALNIDLSFASTSLLCDCIPNTPASLSVGN